MKKITFATLFICAVFMMITSCNSENKQSKNENQSNNLKTEEVSQIYEFEKQATITGILQELQYENTAGTKMVTYIIKLNSPINVISKNSEIDAQNNVKEVQIGFSDEVINPASYLNKTITVAGDIYPEQTVNDRRPVVMINTKIIK